MNAFLQGVPIRMQTNYLSTGCLNTFTASSPQNARFPSQLHPIFQKAKTFVADAPRFAKRRNSGTFLLGTGQVRLPRKLGFDPLKWQVGGNLHCFAVPGSISKAGVRWEVDVFTIQSCWWLKKKVISPRTNRNGLQSWKMLVWTLFFEKVDLFAAKKGPVAFGGGAAMHPLPPLPTGVLCTLVKQKSWFGNFSDTNATFVLQHSETKHPMLDFLS